MPSTHLPHRAVYITFTIMSVESSILGIGRSSIATTWGSLKMTAFIVFLAIAFPVFDYLVFRVSQDKEVYRYGKQVLSGSPLCIRQRLTAKA